MKFNAYIQSAFSFKLLGQIEAKDALQAMELFKAGEGAPYRSQGYAVAVHDADRALPDVERLNELRAYKCTDENARKDKRDFALGKLARQTWGKNRWRI